MYDQLLATIETFYDCVNDGFDHQRAVTAFSAAIDDTGLMLASMDVPQSQMHKIAVHNIPEAAHTLMASDAWDPSTHSFMRLFSAIPTQVPVLRQYFVPDEEHFKSRVYKETTEPWGLHSEGLTLFEKTPAGGTLCTFVRHPGQSAIDHELLSRMAVLNKHLWRALSLHRKLSKFDKALIHANNVLDLIEFGLVLFGDSEAPVFVNKSASRIFEANDGMELTARGLNIHDNTANQQFQNILSALTRDRTPLAARAGGIIRVPRPSRQPPYSLMVVPVPGQCTSGFEKVGATVFVFDPAIEKATVIELFASSHDLTRSEAILAHELAQGTSLDDFARKRGISRNTAKSQLHSIFAKTETSRQPELVSLLLRSVAGINLG